MAQPQCSLPKAGALIVQVCRFTPLHLFIGARVPGLLGCTVPWYQATGSNSNQAPFSEHCSFHSEGQGRVYSQANYPDIWQEQPSPPQPLKLSESGLPSPTRAKVAVSAMAVDRRLPPLGQECLFESPTADWN